ncbi:hypothetical protein ASPVEDRAFT_81102 [Aspergillus versicolor CBS 583.65]|uniref:Uncharacterized protein n=1 Tax=Aspergillus versicolor CBS 583.65 TaxID=1036611 RepID=A0A1L9PD84_ASPVE|nr:uncharacterized protein ASPVEDRAFT_81102 [Aspergillus versicolor CBS 583.65]OJI99490.1 hypothetical protein ASPVEDRAFT_81102 [Aspergillus versicolor CBS 583.65]
MLDRERPGTKTFTEATPLLQKAAPIVPAQECQQHIQLLRCFLNLKQTVLKTKGLFKTEYVHEIKNGLDPIARQSAAEESRWSIYVSRAIHRFSIWWTRLSVTGTPGPGSNQLLEKSYGPHGGWTWTGDQMPPLDVLMVLHALALHTKAFGEDCFRHQKMALWNGGFPLQLASQYIDPDNFEYSCPEPCRLQFENMTKLAWDNVNDPENLPIECFRCQKQTAVPWTTRRGKGLADDGFLQVCQWCKFILRKDALLAQKLRRDLHLLLETNIPLPGTCWSVDNGLAPNETTDGLLKQPLVDLLLEETRPTNLFPNITQIIQASTEAAEGQSLPLLHNIFEHYQYVGTSSCDLHTAVMRVSKSASTLQSADCLDLSQIESLYTHFLREQSKGSSRRSAPQTDIMDPLSLVWSTHLLRPRSYCDFSRHFGNSVPVDWGLQHESETCSVCQTLCPPSFARRFIRGLTSLSEWKEWLSTV